ncbi:cell division protein FtsQ/DivIB [Sneathiella chinensis]|uniref:cell division protein FtsQ/DivIB n=1 Tax=Sneathiella chinensis TaxID=349750 RepID=UPI00146A0FA7|nr:cell division protein FtsQ/DivIB [Sneathiella chinensis]
MPSVRASLSSAARRLAGLRIGFPSMPSFALPSLPGRGTRKRRGPLSVWRGPVALGGGLALAAALLGGTGYYATQNNWPDRVAGWFGDTGETVVVGLGLTVQEISVLGRDRTPAADIMKVLDVERGQSILAFDPEEARARVEALGWVESAAVMRRYPDEIFIRIKERRPFARWQIEGQTSIIDRHGEVVTQADDPEFRYLPKVVGKGANTGADDLFDMLAETPALFTRLKNAVRVRDRRWNLEFDNGVTVLLPEERAKAAWAELYAMQTRDEILSRDVMAIDLRAADRVFVRLKPGEAAERRKPKSET